MRSPQLDYWKHGTGRFLWWLVVTAPLWAIGVFIVIRDGVLPPRFREVYALQFLPSARTYWYWYVIGALVYVVIVMFFVAPAANRGTLREVKERHRASFRRYRERIASSPPIPTLDLQTSHDLVKLKPNLVRSMGKLIEAHWEKNGVIVQGSSGSAAGTFQVLPVLYHNSPDTRPKRRIAGLDAVYGELTYSYFDRNDIQKIHHGAWLDESDNKVTIGITGKRNLVVATLESDNQLCALEREFDGAHPEGVTRPLELSSDLIKIRTRLIAASDGSIIDNFEMILEVLREPNFQVTLSWAFAWKMSHLTDLRSKGYDLLFEAYAVGSEAHEKGKVIGDFFNAEILAASRARLEEIAVHAKKWESRAADFIGTHFGDKAKTDFLNRTPTIDAGLQRQRKKWMHLIGPPIRSGSETKQEFKSPNWDLTDSITARIDNLEGLEKQMS
jgi:hypothetical protein